MNKYIVMSKNRKFIYMGIIFANLPVIFISYFLPYFLKEKGLGVLEIGALITAGLAIGTLLTSIIFSKILRRIKLSRGLVTGGLLGTLQAFSIFLFPSSIGAVMAKFFSEIKKGISKISLDVTLQHNSTKKNKQNTINNSIIIDSISVVLGIALSIFLIKLIDYRFAAFVLVLLSLLGVYFYSRVDERTRFKLPKEAQLPNVQLNLKLILFAEILYWFALASSFALVITFLVTDLFSASIEWLGILFGSLFLAIMISTFFSKKYLSKFNLFKMSILGMFILFLAATLIIFSKNIYVILAAFIIEGIGAGIWLPHKTALHWKLTGKESREKVSGFLFGGRNLVSALGPLFGGFLVVQFNILAPFYFRAGICLIVVGLYLYTWKKYG